MLISNKVNCFSPGKNIKLIYNRTPFLFGKIIGNFFKFRFPYLFFRDWIYNNQIQPPGSYSAFSKSNCHSHLSLADNPSPFFSSDSGCKFDVNRFVSRDRRISQLRTVGQHCWCETHYEYPESFLCLQKAFPFCIFWGGELSIKQSSSKAAVYLLSLEKLIAILSTGVPLCIGFPFPPFLHRETKQFELILQMS